MKGRMSTQDVGRRKCRKPSKWDGRSKEIERRWPKCSPSFVSRRAMRRLLSKIAMTVSTFDNRSDSFVSFEVAILHKLGVPQIWYVNCL
jgi:hypothetical protein